MAFDKPWDETTPDGDSDTIDFGDDEIRNLKYSVRERAAVDHVAVDDETGVTTIGYHKKVTLLNSTVVAVGEDDAGIVHVEDVDGSDDLAYTNSNSDKVLITKGDALNAEALGGTLPAAIKSQMWPVGCIYISITGVNPNTELGFGTWSAFGAGRVMVGYDASDEDFEIEEATGGEKEHTLTKAEIPDYLLKANNAHRANTPYQYGDGVGGPTYRVDDLRSGGGGAAHNNLQPYIVVHMWKRTA